MNREDAKGIERLEPVIITIFGATGDLAQKKLFPALFQLYKKDILNEKFHIVGFSRRPWDDEEFRQYISEVLKDKIDSNEIGTFEMFLRHLHYVSGNIDNLDSYKILKEKINSLDQIEKTSFNKAYYLSITPSFYETTVKNISISELIIPKNKSTTENKKNWTRVMIEKPFGNNLIEAKKLNNLLETLFDESQIFRIDHYLEKEPIQNILTFRFANNMFEPIWNKKYIEKITISLIEDNVVGSRGTSYDKVGALRDVGQNHILQILALTTMENPNQSKNDTIQSCREKILKQIYYKHKSDSLIKAQYIGYLMEPGVDPSSLTETYFRTEIAIKNKRFNGVPIILESGKGFKESKTQIVISFKTINDRQNKIVFSIQPKENISITIITKEPSFGQETNIKELNLNNYNSKNGPEAYQKVFYDGLRGDKTFFTSATEVLEEWRIITEILKYYEDVDLLTYPIGSNPNNLQD